MLTQIKRTKGEAGDARASSVTRSHPCTGECLFIVKSIGVKKKKKRKDETTAYFFLFFIGAAKYVVEIHLQTPRS